MGAISSTNDYLINLWTRPVMHMEYTGKSLLGYKHTRCYCVYQESASILSLLAILDMCLIPLTGTLPGTLGNQRTIVTFLGIYSFARDSFIINISMHFGATLEVACSDCHSDLVSPVRGGAGRALWEKRLLSRSLCGDFS